MMNNNYCFALLCYFMTLCVTNHGCYGQQFVPLYDLLSVQKTDKLDFTIDSPITNGVRISWSINSHEYRIHATHHADIETFHSSRMRKIFMAGDVVKIIVIDTEYFWVLQFSSAISAREFYERDEPRESTTVDLPYLNIDIVDEETPLEHQTFYNVALYMKIYGQPQNDHKMFILKPSPQTDRSQPILPRQPEPSEPIFMVFLSGRFSIEKIGDRIRFTFEDAEDRSCTMFIRNDGGNNVDSVYDVISRYALSMYSDETGWVNNPRYDDFDLFSPNY